MNQLLKQHKQQMKQALTFRPRRSLAGLMAMMTLMACSPAIELVPLTATPVNETRFVASERPGGSLGLELTSPPRGFRLLEEGDEDGLDLRSLRLYLVSGNAGSQNPVLGPFVLNTSQLDQHGKSQFVSFHNVPPGAYYVAASAYDGSGNNLTAEGQTGHISVLDGGPEHAYVTTLGGESSTFPGRVTVNPDLSITGQAQLQLHLYVQGGGDDD